MFVNIIITWLQRKIINVYEHNHNMTKRLYDVLCITYLIEHSRFRNMHRLSLILKYNFHPLSINKLIKQSIDQSIYHFISQLINQSVSYPVNSWSISQLVGQSDNQSVKIWFASLIIVIYSIKLYIIVFNIKIYLIYSTSHNIFFILYWWLLP